MSEQSIGTISVAMKADAAELEETLDRIQSRIVSLTGLANELSKSLDALSSKAPAINVKLEGQSGFTREQVINLIEKINELTGDGIRLQ